jgi:preprotein translocase subunit SecY
MKFPAKEPVMTHYDQNPAPTYRPEKPNYVKTGVKTLFFMVIYHAVTWILYVLFMSPVENQMIGDEHEPEFRWVMFGFSLLTLLVIAIIMTVFYFKNGDRKRAYLAATSVEVRGAENIAEGERRYRKLALTEAVVCTAVTAFLWLLPAGFYTAALNASGMGYGYGSAWGIETFFTGVIGFFQPFQNAWIGMTLALAILFCFHYFGRLFSHKNWAANRIRR